MGHSFKQAMPELRPLRTIRSFACRQGRLTKGQSRALGDLWPDLGLDPNARIGQFVEVFGRAGPTVLEIGFGMGESLAHMALTNPDHNYIGIEVHRPGIGHLLTLVEEHNLKNVRIYYADAVRIIKQCLPNNSLHGTQIFFPDPWHKRRHHKRRLIQTEFVTLLTDKLVAGGFIHLATDWQDYASHMLTVLEQNPNLRNSAPSLDFIPRPDTRPLTKFETRGHGLGHGVWDLMFKKS